MNKYKLKTSQEGTTHVAVILAVVVLAVACAVGLRILGSKSTNTGSNPQPTQSDSIMEKKEVQPPKPVEAASGVVITTGDSEFGPMLFNEKKQAIYIWEVEKSPTAECYGNCADLWPPVLTDGTPQATGDVNSQLLGTTKRTDGTTQVTYNGHPLYYYAHENAGEVKCHNIRTHGGLWWVIQPNGNRAK